MASIIATAEVSNKTKAYTSELQINQHQLMVDEPMDKGGEDTGPAPGDYLCAALASCKAITLRMYAERKQWNVGEIKVKVDLERDNSTDPSTNIFLSEISFTGKVDEEQRKRLEVIANSCPLHKLLSRPNEIRTTMIAQEV